MNGFKRRSHQGKGTKKQDCLRPLCGSQPTNPPGRCLRTNNKITTPQLHQQHRCSEACCNHKISHHHPHGGGRYGSKGYGGHSVGETPGPIPNPEAKTHSADGTAPGRVWESRSPPEHHYTVESPNHQVGALPHLTPKPPSRTPTGRTPGTRTAPRPSTPDTPRQQFTAMPHTNTRRQLPTHHTATSGSAQPPSASGGSAAASAPDRAGSEGTSGRTPPELRERPLMAK